MIRIAPVKQPHNVAPAAASINSMSRQCLRLRSQLPATLEQMLAVVAELTAATPADAAARLSAFQTATVCRHASDDPGGPALGGTLYVHGAVPRQAARKFAEAVRPTVTLWLRGQRVAP